MSGSEDMERKHRLRLVDARDKATRLRQVYEATETPQRRLLIDVCEAAVTFHSRLSAYVPEADLNRSDRTRIIKKTGRHPERSADEAAELIDALENQFDDLGFGRLLKG